jgi:hypothetical protein
MATVEPVALLVGEIIRLAEDIARIVAGHPQSQIDELLPWAYIAELLKAVA